MCLYTLVYVTDFDYCNLEKSVVHSWIVLGTWSGEFGREYSSSETISVISESGHLLILDRETVSNTVIIFQ